MRIEITGIEEVKAFLDRRRDYTKILSRFIKDLQGYAREITHVDTGAWRGSHDTNVMTNQAELFVDPGAINPKSGTPVVVYAEVWQNRGGEMDVYGRTVAAVDMSALEEEIVSEVLM